MVLADCIAASGSGASADLTCGGAPPENYGVACSLNVCSSGTIGCDGSTCEGTPNTVPANYGQACLVCTPDLAPMCPVGGCGGDPTCTPGTIDCTGNCR
jgi:hypothetical protein